MENNTSENRSSSCFIHIHVFVGV